MHISLRGIMVTAFKTNRNILFYLIMLTVAASQTGCFKSDIRVDVKPDGSGAISVSVGMTKEAQILASDQDTNPLQDMEKILSSKISAALTGIEVNRWSEDNYDWVNVAKGFNSLEEINNALNKSTLFNRFSLTRKHGILQDEFILDAELPALGSMIPPEYSLVDTSAYIQMSFSANLPGQIVESNGIADDNNPNHLVWNIPLFQVAPVKARSLAWNWVNILGISTVSLILASAGVYALTIFVRRKRKKTLHQNNEN